MKKVLELTIERMTMGGEALASHQGKKVFIPWGVPGDRAKVEIVEERGDFSRGRIVELLENSEARTQAPCQYFFKCGGCQWQHVKYEVQLQFKNEILKECLQRIAKIHDLKIHEPIPSDSPLHYRNRIRLQLSRQGELGFFKGQSKEVVPIDECLIADPGLNEKIPEAKAISVGLIQKDRATRHEIEIRRVGKGVVVEANPQDEIFFVQVNPSQNERLIQVVIQVLHLTGKENVLELFAGEGNFSFPISEGAGSVTAVEMAEAAVLRAEKKKEELHRRNVQFVQSTAYRFLESISLSQNPPNPPFSKGGDLSLPPFPKGGRGGFDRILLDPPRKGAVQCLEGIARLKIPILVYVSCDPSTLARDVKILGELGYRHESSQVIDMFPQTHHVESVTKMVLS